MAHSKLHAVLLTLTLASSAAGCMKNQYTVGGGAPTHGDPDFKHWNAHWLWGLVGEHNTDITDVCPSGRATIKERTTFVNGLVAALVGTIYHPTTVKVWCADETQPADGHMAELELTPDQMRTAAMQPQAVALARDTDERLAEQLDRSQKRYAATLAP